MSDAPRRQVAAIMAEAARSWLDMLTPDQREIALGHPPSDAATDGERRRWFYTPTDHGGLTVHQQRPAQQRAAMRLVATGLSRPGYVTVATIMGLENILDQAEGFVTRFATRGCITCASSVFRAATAFGAGASAVITSR